jgi:hypothetical protein
MAKHVWRDGYIQVNAVDLSDHASAVGVEGTTEEVDLTSFTTAGYREIGTGFKTANITATFFNDFAAGSVDATLQPLWDAGGTFAVHVKPTQSATSATNPRYSLGTARIMTYSPFGGGVGDPNSFEATFVNAGTLGLTRGTTGTP